MAKNEMNDEKTNSKQMTTMDAMALTCTTKAKTTTTTTTTVTMAANYTIEHRKNRNLRDTRWQRQNVQQRMSGFRMVSSLSALWPFLLMLSLLTIQAIMAEEPHQSHNTAPTSAAAAVANTKYSQPFATGVNADDDDSFHPIIPQNINPEMYSRNIFTETGQYRVFQPVESDLRATAAMTQKVSINRRQEVVEGGPVALTARNSIKQGETSTPMSIMTTTTAKSSGNLMRDETITKTGEHAEAEEEEGIVENHEDEEEAEEESGEYDDEDSETAAGRENLDLDLNEIPQGNHESSSTTTSMPINDNDTLSSDLKGLEDLLVEYVQNFFSKGQYEPLPGLVLELQKNHTNGDISPHKRRVRQATSTSEGSVSINLPRAFQTGRLLFFAGLKKIMWPIYMGLQILKSVLFAMFLPTLIGSFGKLIGKGITSGSVPLFIRPMDAPQELDFKDNTFNFEDDNKFIMNDDGGKDVGYAYNQPEASQTQNQYAYNAVGINNQALSRYGMNEQQKMQDSYLSALQSISSASFKNSNSISGSSSAGLGGGGGGGGGGGMTSPVRNKPAAPANMNTFTTFQRVPASSLLLSNYDPFYSPLLSRLDSVFAQLKLNSENEVCREKLICLMYANPAKYAPYSNLVSAQLSRELNELRKPTSDNPDILRFFKYMRAAKDGQDGIECEKAFDGCKEFKDFENPAMVSTYHDINKLVQARKMT